MPGELLQLALQGDFSQQAAALGALRTVSVGALAGIKTQISQRGHGAPGRAWREHASASRIASTWRSGMTPLRASQ